MAKGTKIKFKGQKYNEDGDRPLNLQNIPKVDSKEAFESAFDDPEIHFIHVTDERLFGVDKLEFRNKKFTLVEPNPVTFYFSLAYDSIFQLEEASLNLESVLMLDERKSQKSQAFSFVYRVSSIGIIFSFLALEAFLNQILPDDRLIKYKGKEVSKERIERYAPFTDKLFNIIPSITKKSFEKEHPEEIKNISQLKVLRDKITHLKEVKNGFTSYNEVYQDVLNADLKLIVMSVKNLINFYSPELIENFDKKTKIK